MNAENLRALQLVFPALIGAGAMLLPFSAAAQATGEFVVEKVAEKAIDALPEGELYWTAETFPTLKAAEAAADTTSIAAEAGGRAWLLTLGPETASGHGGEVLATVGPIDRFDAPDYLLWINVSDAPPGSMTGVHSHPGTEAIYVLSGEVTIQWPDRTETIAAGESQAGQPPNTPMMATSTGEEDLVELIMFLVDSGQEFSKPEVMN